MMNDPGGSGQPGQPWRADSLCPHCANVKIIVNDRGSPFYLCQLSATDPHFPKYPPQPVLRCTGFVSSR